MTPSPSTIIWDFNGTLLNDIDAILAANNELNCRYGIAPITAQYYRDFFAYPPMDFYQSLGYCFEKTSYSEISAQFMECYQHHAHLCRLSDGVAQALELFYRCGMEQMVLSAHNQKMLEDHLQQLGIAHYFSCTSGDDGVVVTGKAERARQLAASRNLGHAVLIGDTSHDFETACALGCPCVLYSGGHESPQRLQRLGVPVFSSFRQIARYILESPSSAGPASQPATGR